MMVTMKRSVRRTTVRRNRRREQVRSLRRAWLPSVGEAAGACSTISCPPETTVTVGGFTVGSHTHSVGHSHGGIDPEAVRAVWVDEIASWDASHTHWVGPPSGSFVMLDGGRLDIGIEPTLAESVKAYADRYRELGHDLEASGGWCAPSSPSYELGHELVREPEVRTMREYAETDARLTEAMTTIVGGLDLGGLDLDLADTVAVGSGLSVVPWGSAPPPPSHVTRARWTPPWGHIAAVCDGVIVWADGGDMNW